MRSIKFNLSKKFKNSWDMAILLTEAYLSSAKKSDQLLDLLPSQSSTEVRARSQSLFLGALRHGHRVSSAAQALFRKPPRPALEAIILVTGYELIHESAETSPQIVHHAVERSKGLTRSHEQGFLNAVLRKLAPVLSSQSDSSDLAIRYSHPSWLVQHWVETLGEKDCEALLEWNQRIPGLYFKIPQRSESLPSSLKPSSWKDFYVIDKSANWKRELEPLLNSGNAYIKDPSTRLAPELLAPQPGEQVLDLCAAPGGKAFDLANAMNRSGQIVTVDLPGNRIARLRENLDRITNDQLQTAIVEADLTELSKQDFETRGLPGQYDAVMLDAPCSNTGVIQRRTDVKWRLKESDIEDCAKLQQQLIHSAARFVKPGGRLVYSTCSIEPIENRQIIDGFLSSKSGQSFNLAREEISLPWQSRHDGASAFLLEKESWLHSQDSLDSTRVQ